MKLLHKIIFWSHLLAGLIAGLVIFIMSFTGVVLMYEPQISEYSERNARWVTRGLEATRLSLDELVVKVREGNPDARPAVITVKSDPYRFRHRQSWPREQRFHQSLHRRTARRLVGDAQLPP